jgi:hypothetical protein
MNTNLLIKTVVLYALAFLADYVANIYNFKFAWLVFLPIATAANTLFFDLLLGHVDFSSINNLKDSDRGIHTVALTVLSAGFAIATAIFFK